MIFSPDSPVQWAMLQATSSRVALPKSDALAAAGRKHWVIACPNFTDTEKDALMLALFPSVPMKMRHPPPGNLDLRARKDHHAHAYAHPPDSHRVPPT